MLSQGGRYTDPELDPTSKIITYREVVAYVVFLCFAVVVALFVGAYLGRQSVIRNGANESIGEQLGRVVTPNEVSPSQRVVESKDAQSQDTKKDTQSQNIGSESPTLSSPTSTNVASSQGLNRSSSTVVSEENTSPTDNSSATQSMTNNEGSVSSGVDSSKSFSSTPFNTQVVSSDNQVANLDKTVHQGEGSSPVTEVTVDKTMPVHIDLQPITPPMEVENSESKPTKSQTRSTNQSVSIPVRKPKTYSVQLSVLTGEEAQKRAKALLMETSKKYPQYQFTLEKVGKGWKILAINFPNEKSAREAIKVFSRENDFKGAFLIRP